MQRPTRVLGLLLYLSTLSLLAAADSTAPVIEIVATYDGGTVTKSELDSWSDFMRSEANETPTGTRVASIAFHKTMAERAVRNRLDKDPVVRVALATAEARILEQALRLDVADAIEVSTEELEAAFERGRSAYQRPPRVKLWNLSLEYGKTATPEEIETTRKRLEVLRQRVIDGESFPELAASQSDSQTRFRDGKIGWMRRAELPNDLAEIAFALNPGETSEILETRHGYTLLFCEATDPGARPSDEEVRERIEASLRRERMDSLWQETVQPAQRVELRLPSILIPSSTVAQLKGIDLGSEEARAVVEFSHLGSPESLPPQVLEQSLRTHLERRLVLREARSRGLDQVPKTASRLHWTQITTLSNVALAAEVERRFVPLVEDEIRTYYEENVGRFIRPAQTLVRAFAVSSHKDTLPTDYDLVESIAEKIQAGEVELTEVARDLSQHPSASQSGDLGWLDRVQIAALGPNVLITLDELELGETSGIVQQPEGLTGRHTLWIVQAVDRRPAKQLPFDAVKMQAENALGNERTRALAAAIRLETLDRLQVRPVSEDRESSRN